LNRPQRSVWYSFWSFVFAIGVKTLRTFPPVKNVSANQTCPVDDVYGLVAPTSMRVGWPAPAAVVVADSAEGSDCTPALRATTT
jgi:hypothetical protein